MICLEVNLSYALQIPQTCQVCASFRNGGVKGGVRTLHVYIIHGKDRQCMFGKFFSDLDPLLVSFTLSVHNLLCSNQFLFSLLTSAFGRSSFSSS